jgi:hypothetical protein
MAEKLGHFKVVEREAQMLRLERKSELPLMLAALGGILLIVVWFLRPWQFPSGLMVSLVMLVLSLPGIVTVLHLRPWKEMLIFDRPAGHLLRKEQYLLRRSKVMHLPLDTIAGVDPVRRTVHFMDRKGQTAEHVYWAALLRTTFGEEIELDGTNTPERVRELADTINEFIAGSRHSTRG